MAPFKPNVIYEDNHLLVVNKPAGMLTQPDTTGQPSLLEECRAWIKATHGKPGNVFLEAVHRLDKPASGIVLFAKTSKALSRLNASMRAKSARKIYQALVTGSLPQSEGTLVHYLVHGDHRAIVSHAKDPAAKESRLHYKLLRKGARATLVEIHLETGRYHQIRAQFAAIGCPLAGDIRYGGPPLVNGEGIALHHFSLEIAHPIGGEPMLFSAPAPDIFDT